MTIPFETVDEMNDCLEDPEFVQILRAILTARIEGSKANGELARMIARSVLSRDIISTYVWGGKSG